MIITYYTPFRIEKGERIQAAGRLLNHYFYVKAQLWKDGVINLKEAANAKNGSSNYASTKCIAFEDDYIHFLSVIYDVLKFWKYKLQYSLFIAFEKQQIDYLRTHSDDVEIVTQYWRKTHTWRKKLLEIEKIGVQDYLLMFKPLREQLGCDLVTFLKLCKLCALNVKKHPAFYFYYFLLVFYILI